MDAHHSKYMYFTGASQQYVVTMPDSAHSWAKWILRDSRDGNVMLESVRYPDHYLDAHHSSYVSVTHSNYPYNQAWAKWKLTKSGDNYYFESVRYPGYYIHKYRYYGYLYWGRSANSAKMRVYQPEVRQTEKLIFDVDNRRGTTTYTRIITERRGITLSHSTSWSTTVGINIGSEIKNKLLTLGGSLSTTWGSSSSVTWSSETTISHTISVAPGTRKQIWQAVAYYGVDDQAHGPYYRVCSDPPRIVDS